MATALVPRDDTDTCYRCNTPFTSTPEGKEYCRGYHKHCFTCALCDTQLDPMTASIGNHLREVYCNKCQQDHFPKNEPEPILPQAQTIESEAGPNRSEEEIWYDCKNYFQGSSSRNTARNKAKPTIGSTSCSSGDFMVCDSYRIHVLHGKHTNGPSPKSYLSTASTSKVHSAKCTTNSLHHSQLNYKHASSKDPKISSQMTHPDLKGIKICKAVTSPSSPVKICPPINNPGNANNSMYKAESTAMKDLSRSKRSKPKTCLDCSICFDSLLDDSNVGSDENNRLTVVATSCGHIFHEICIKNWLEVAQRNSKCPICCAVIDPKKLLTVFLGGGSRKISGRTSSTAVNRESEGLKEMHTTLLQDYEDLKCKHETLVAEHEFCEWKSVVIQSLQSAYDLESTTRKELEQENGRLLKVIHNYQMDTFVSSFRTKAKS